MARDKWKEKSSSVKISKDIHKRLSDYKEQTGISITFTIERAVSEYLEKRGM